MKQHNDCSALKHFICIFAVMAVANFAATSVPAEEIAGKQRPLSEFLEAQGSNSSFFEPVPDYIGWGDTPFTTFVLIDYAGLADQYLIDHCGTTAGTTVRGSVTERPLPDGKARIRVKLHLGNVMGFAQSGEDLIENNWEFHNTGTIFGNKTMDVCEGATAAVGKATFKVTFTMEQDAPLPDLMDVIYTSDYHPISFELKAKIYEGPTLLRVHMKMAINDKGETWTRELIEIKEKTD